MAIGSPNGTVEHEYNWLFAILFAQVHVLTFLVFYDDGLGRFPNPLGPMIDYSLWRLLVQQERIGKYAGQRHGQSLPVNWIGHDLVGTTFPFGLPLTGARSELFRGTRDAKADTIFPRQDAVQEEGWKPTRHKKARRISRDTFYFTGRLIVCRPLGY